MHLTFSSIKNKEIFEHEFQNLSAQNGTIEFGHKNGAGEIAVVYAPNGTGKSSFVKALSAETSSPQLSFAAADERGKNISPETNSFHLIPEQIHRNVIKGKETDYLIGKQIRREYELIDLINSAFAAAYATLVTRYKTDFGASTVTNYLLNQINATKEDDRKQAYTYIRSIINKKTHGSDISRDEFIAFVRDPRHAPQSQVIDADKRAWVIANSHKGKIVERILKLSWQGITASKEIPLIEQHDDAIAILQKYRDASSCIVCDNPLYDGPELLERKSRARKRIYDSLDKATKEILDKVVKDSSLLVADPFSIRQTLSDFIAGGAPDDLIHLQHALHDYVYGIGSEMITILVHCFDGTSLFKDYDEYKMLTSTQPEFDTDEMLFIEEVINENIGKAIKIERDPSSKNYRLRLGDKDLLGTDRSALELSSGEQNFISLAFELLMARHSDKDYVVLDDPISSFDSVYKNKIAFCIIKFLENKRQIVLTHNVDLIRLLDVQLNNCFKLYILNNVENGQNGFIPVAEKEKMLLINMHSLVQLLQNKDGTLIPAIHNQRQFLMSMIPFMRGYAHISLDPNDYFGKLSKVMHGYSTGSIDVVPIYRELFGYDFNCKENISVADILSEDLNSLDILDKEQYPLLADTLAQTFVYYQLRMKVEKVLVDAFSINTNKAIMLNQIIRNAFKAEKTDLDFGQKQTFRVFFTSRKTLLNEFNHFEGNMNIFQPAIDITPAALQKEISSIESKLKEVRAFAAGSSTQASVAT